MTVGLLAGAVHRHDTEADDEMIDPLRELPWYAGFWASDPQWTPPSVAFTDPTSGLVLPGTTGNYASTPDAAALDITGDITLVARATVADWTPTTDQTFIGKRSTNFSYQLRLTSTGFVNIVWSVDGAAGLAIAANATLTLTDGQPGWVAATLDVDNGAGNRAATFWQSTDGVTWTQVGTTVVQAGTTSIFSGTAPLEIGSISAGSSQLLPGSVSVARVYSGSGFTASGPSGSLVFDADFRRVRCETFTAATGQTVTINSAGAVSSWRNGGTLGTAATQGAGSSQPTFRSSVAALGNQAAVDFDGTDDRLEITSGVSLAQPFSVIWIGTLDTVAANRWVLGLNSGTNLAALGTNGTPNYYARVGAALQSGTPAANTAYMVRTYANTTSSVIVANGSTVASGTVGAGSMDQIILGAGRTAPSTYANHQDGKTAFLGIFPGDITTHPQWEPFKQWVRQTYGITVV